LPGSGFELIGAYRTSLLTKIANFDTNKFDQGCTFVRTTANSKVEVFMAHQKSDLKQIRLEKMTLTMPTNGAANTIVTKHWYSMDDSDI
jgi:hypothetical protein